MNTDTNLCDIRVGDHVVEVFRLGKLILSKHQGRPFTVAEDAELGELIAAAITLDEFTCFDQ